jgi:hypothetical protein
LFLKDLLCADIPRPSNDTGSRARPDDRTRRRPRNRRTRRSFTNKTTASAGDLARPSQAQGNMDTANGDRKVQLTLAHGKLGGTRNVVESVWRHWVIIGVVGTV